MQYSEACSTGVAWQDWKKCVNLVMMKYSRATIECADLWSARGLAQKIVIDSSFHVKEIEIRSNFVSLKAFEPGELLFKPQIIEHQPG